MYLVRTISRIIIVFCLSFAIQNLNAALFTLNFPGEILGAKMITCNRLNCLTVESPRIVVGALDRNYSFDQISLHFRKLNTQKDILFLLADEAYLDRSTSLLFIRKLKGEYAERELMVNLNTLEFQFSKNTQ